MSRLHKISGCERDDRKADVVFLHGLGGDAFGTWRHGQDETTSWPHWLGEEFPEVGVWSLGYAASASKWARIKRYLTGDRDAGHGMALPDRAAQVLNRLEQARIGQRPLFLISHSLGGLVAKQVLRKAKDDDREFFHQTRAVLFLATPHAGAMLASLAKEFGRLFGSTVTIEDLKAHDAHLRDLGDWYRKHAGTIETVAYFETRAYKGVTVVNPTSAHPMVGREPVGLDDDQLSIAKPPNKEHQVWGAACELLRDYVLAVKPQKVTAAAANAATPAPAQPIQVTVVTAAEKRRIPHELPAAAEQFFGRQTQVAALVQRLKAGHRFTAVTGPAGMGKTAVAAEALRQVVGSTPAALDASPFPDGVVFLDLYALKAAAETVWNKLADRLEGGEFLERRPAGERAEEACRAKRLLVVIEGGEEADGQEGRAGLPELRSVLSLENTCLLLTRTDAQAKPAERVELRNALEPADAAALLQALTGGRLAVAVRERLLKLLAGHPLALTWVGGLDWDLEEPETLLVQWEAESLPSLHDPADGKGHRTLDWLFGRSVRGLNGAGMAALQVAGLLAHTPFPAEAVTAALGDAARATDALKVLAQRNLLRKGKGLWQCSHVLGYGFARERAAAAEATLRERLAQWLAEDLRRSLAQPVQDEAVSGGLAHLAALLRLDGQQELWRALANPALYEIRDRLTEVGRLVWVADALRAVGEWMAVFPPEKAQEPDWLRERMVVGILTGDVLRDQGDLAGALAAYQQSLAVSRRLAEADASNAGWQRDLSYTMALLAQVLDQLRRRPEALGLARESLTIAERLAALDRTNVMWQKDVAASRALVRLLEG